MTEAPPPPPSDDPEAPPPPAAAGTGFDDDDSAAIGGWDDDRGGSLGDYTTRQHGSGSSKAWMVTFTDLVSLMLTFFVMLFAMSHVKVDEWDKMIDSLSQTLNPTRTQTVAIATSQYNIRTTFWKEAKNLDYLAAVLDEKAQRTALLRESRIMRLDDRMVIALPGDLLFEPGRAIMNQKARDAMFVLGAVLANVGNQIGVNGHSDPLPPDGAEYDSNWELSVARAVAVANALRRAGYADDIVSLGYADTRYRQLPDLPEAERRALGRRVDIVVFPTAGGL